jgi:hypothetical protein
VQFQLQLYKTRTLERRQRGEKAVDARRLLLRIEALALASNAAKGVLFL